MENPKQLPWTCRCCDTEYEDDFRCISSKNVCMNCCACAFGMATPDIENKTCVPTPLPPNEKDLSIDKNDLPF